jgi:hypothetical protein
MIKINLLDNTTIELNVASFSLVKLTKTLYDCRTNRRIEDEFYKIYIPNKQHYAINKQEYERISNLKRI